MFIEKKVIVELYQHLDSPDKKQMINQKSE